MQRPTYGEIIMRATGASSREIVIEDFFGIELTFHLDCLKSSAVLASENTEKLKFILFFRSRLFSSQTMYSPEKSPNLFFS